eukprot:scaffold674_cov63-Cyclotella_meneghiniana.AAC.11
MPRIYCGRSGEASYGPTSEGTSGNSQQKIQAVGLQLRMARHCLRFIMMTQMWVFSLKAVRAAGGGRHGQRPDVAIAAHLPSRTDESFVLGIFGDGARRRGRSSRRADDTTTGFAVEN